MLASADVSWVLKRRHLPFNILCKNYKYMHKHNQNMSMYAHAYIAQCNNRIHEKLYCAHTVTNVHNMYNIELQINFLHIYIIIYIYIYI